jgi:hypothetical protein
MVKTKNPYQNIWFWILATVLLGTFWHFGYELFGKNFLAGMVFPINESVWEHQKIVYFPLLIAGIVGYIKSKNTRLWLGTFMGVMIAMLAVFFGFYLYSAFVADSLLADIILYVLSIILGMYTAWWVVINLKSAQKFAVPAIVGLIIIAAVLVYLTINPTKLGPFIEGSSQTYGIYEKSAE